MIFYDSRSGRVLHIVPPLRVTLLERRFTLSRPRKTRRLVSFRSKGSLHIVMYHETTVGCSERQERAYPSHQDGPSQPVHAWP